MTRRRLRRARQILVGGLFLAAFAVLFWPTFAWMGERFDAVDSFYSHGWLIPPASAWLIWRRRALITRLRSQPSYWGFALLIPAATVQVLAAWWQLGFVSGFAMVGVVWGLVWTLWGGMTLRVLRVPLLFLFFMVPLPGVLLLATSFKMKLIAAQLATPIVKLMGIPAVLAGSTIHIPGVSVMIDHACSGLRSLITMVALATLWTVLLPATVSRRSKWLIVAAAVPIALMANMVRILVLIVIMAVFGLAAAEGFLHVGSGIVVFGVALVALAGFSQLVTAWTPVRVSHNSSR